MSFNDEDIRAIVHTGGLTNSEAEQYLIQTLIERRDKIGRYYFNQVLALDRFSVNVNGVAFAHLQARHNFAAQPKDYTLSWFRFDNAKNEKMFLGNAVAAAGATFQIPSELMRDGTPYFGVEIRDGEKQAPKGEAKVTLFMRNVSPASLVGIDRTWHVQ
jgi:hypothetical protein